MGGLSNENFAAGYPPNVDFICGWCAGCIETCILFPLSKMTFRQQLHGVYVKDAFRQLFTEGIPNLYRGLLPPLIQRTSTRMVMFGMFDTYKRLLGCSDQPFSLCYIFSAMLGTTEAALCPLERVQILLQTSEHHSKFRNTVEAFRFVRGYGLGEFYRGVSLVIARNSLSNALFFTIRDPLKDELISSLTMLMRTFNLPNVEQSSMFAKPNEIPVNSLSDDAKVLLRGKAEKSNIQQQRNDMVQNNVPLQKLILYISNFVSGAVLGAGISTIFFPLNVVKHRMQSVIGSKFLSPSEVFKVVWKERNQSFRELYRGVHLNYTRSLLTWGITNTVYEALRNFFMSSS